MLFSHSKASARSSNTQPVDFNLIIICAFGPQACFVRLASGYPYHEVTRLQRRNENVLDVGLEAGAIDRTIEDEGRDETVAAQRR